MASTRTASVTHTTAMSDANDASVRSTCVKRMYASTTPQKASASAPAVTAHRVHVARRGAPRSVGSRTSSGIAVPLLYHAVAYVAVS